MKLGPISKRDARVVDINDLFGAEREPERDWSQGIVVDNFAGGGGASTGIEAALNYWADFAAGTGAPCMSRRYVDVAINHDEEAIAMHTANHPRTRHHCQSIWSIDPLEAVTIDGVVRPVWLAWFSPDCTHHSNARGGKPREKGIRDLAWVVVSWVERLGPKYKPAIIKVENVEEFLTWGPLDDDGKRIAERNGEEFQRWVKALRSHGYKVEWRVLRASKYNTPTIRKRLVLVARCDGLPIIWPEETNGPGRTLPYRTAAECIDWSIPCPSIFLTKEEGRALGVKRPLAEATMARIARGVQRYVIDAAQPFIVNLTHHGSDRNEGVEEPFKTVTGAHRGEKALIVPIVSYAQQGGGNRSVDDPLHTVCASTKDQNTVVAAHITKFHTGSTGHPIDEPMHTVTANSYIERPGGATPIGIVAATLVQTGYGEREGQAPRAMDIDVPLGTVVAGGGKHAVVAAFLAQHNTMPNGGIHAGHSVEEPVSTVTTTGSHQAVVATHMISLKGSDRRASPSDEPVPAITAGGYHVGEVRAFLLKYYGNESEGHDIDAPIGTVTTKDRFGLVMVHGEAYQIVDIGMRMLTPRELFAAQGFPADYIIDPIGPNGKALTKTAQIRMCGNSVCPPLAEALVRANCGAPAVKSVAA